MSQFSGLYIAISGMNANMAAMETASNNIANVSTPGYTRQETTLVSNNSYQSTYYNGQVGSGVKIEGVSRIADAYLEKKIQREQASTDNWSTQYGLLEKVESSITALSLPDALASFWDSWHEASMNTDQGSGLFSVKQQAESLINSLKEAGNQLDEIENEINDRINDQLKQVNNITEQIVLLNKEISQGIAKGQEPNNLLDQRELLLRDLVGMTGANVTYNKDETVTITLPVKTSASGEVEELVIVDKLNFTKITDSSALAVTNGSLYGLIQVRDTELESYQTILNDFAKSLVEEVNAVHSTGYTVNGAAGGNFFKEPVAEVGDLALSDQISADYNNIAINGDDSTELGLTALNIYNLSSNLSGGISTLLSNIGAAVQSSEFQANSHEDLIYEMDSLRAQVSGVSTNEELANIIQYQRGYEACAKVFSVIDDMLDTLINMV